MLRPAHQLASRAKHRSGDGRSWSPGAVNGEKKNQKKTKKSFFSSPVHHRRTHASRSVLSVSSAVVCARRPEAVPSSVRRYGRNPGLRGAEEYVPPLLSPHYRLLPKKKQKGCTHSSNSQTDSSPVLKNLRARKKEKLARKKFWRKQPKPIYTFRRAGFKPRTRRIFCWI